MSLHIFRRDQYHTCHFVLFGPLSLLTSLYIPLTHFYALVECPQHWTVGSLPSFVSVQMCLSFHWDSYRNLRASLPILQPTLLHPLGHNISRTKI